MKKTLVSIIIPSYEGENNIVSVVESALTQDYKNIEVIVVDDNGRGTEHQLNTKSALSKYFDNPKFYYIAHEVNRNGSSARNTGLAYCSGQYVAFLDDDDYFYPNKIECCVNALKDTDDSYAFAYSAYELVYPGKRTEIIAPKKDGDILDAFILGDIRLCSSSIVLKKKVVDEVNGFDESFRRHQDWEFLIRILIHHKAVYVNEVAMKKVMLWRNTPGTPEIYEKYRIHFLEKMAPIFAAREPKVYQQVYDRHYFDIAKAYMKRKQVKKALYWIKKTSHSVYYVFQVIPDTLAYKKKNRF